jgi:hypothetical protein
LYSKDSKLDEKTLTELKKRWTSTKDIEIFCSDLTAFESLFGFINPEWFVQQALIMLEHFESHDKLLVHTDKKQPTITIEINGRLHDALMLKADQYKCEFRPFVLSLVNSYASHVGYRVTATQ